MRVAIIAILISLAALGLAGFAAFSTLENEDAVEPIATQTFRTWPKTECDNLRDMLPRLRFGCATKGRCEELLDMLQALNDNCP